MEDTLGQKQSARPQVPKAAIREHLSSGLGDRTGTIRPSPSNPRTMLVTAHYGRNCHPGGGEGLEWTPAGSLVRTGH